MDVNAIVERIGQKYRKGFVGMFGAAVSSRLAWKHGPIKISSLEAEVAKILYKRRGDGDRGSPLNIGPLGEVLLKLGEFDWHFGQGGERLDEEDKELS